MKGINKVQLIGHVGKDPEYQTLQDGTQVAKINLATTESVRLKDGGIHHHTEWHNIIAWRGLAGLAHQYVHKGSMLYIEGRLRSRQYEDKSGQKKYITEIVADQILLLDKKTKKEEAPADESPEDLLPF
ncbi:MAG: single-stranded DNA-binding protein [Bacteroidetes bacterium]|nr:single-stranded DNA-binding protein [Bacteroidota bacterium]